MRIYRILSLKILIRIFYWFSMFFIEWICWISTDGIFWESRGRTILHHFLFFNRTEKWFQTCFLLKKGVVVRLFSRENAYLLALWDRWRFIRNHSFRYSPRNTDFRIRSQVPTLKGKDLRKIPMFFEDIHLGYKKLSAFNVKDKISREWRRHFCYSYLF